MTQEITIGLATLHDLQQVAEVCNMLHAMEGGEEWEVGADKRRTLQHLWGLLQDQTGSVLVAKAGTKFLGCVVLEYNIVPRSHSVFVGGLFTDFNAPHKAAVYLMYAAALLCRKLKLTNVYMRSGIPKNQGRRTYEQMGFRDTEMMQGNTRLYLAKLRHIEAALEERLKYSGINR